MISELAKLLRVSLSRGKTIISIKDELQHSRSYMNIQLARYKERFKTEFRIEKEIENYCIVKLVIQPILEMPFIMVLEIWMRMRTAGLSSVEKRKRRTS